MTEQNVAERVSIRSLVDFLMETCGAAIECGCSSNRVELLVMRLGDAWGYQVDAAALPTAVWLSVRGRGEQIQELVRVRTWTINLERLAQLNDLVDDVENHRMFLEEAVEKLRIIRQTKSIYPRWLIILAGGGSSIALVYANGGRSHELLVAFALGIICQLSIWFFSKENRRYLGEFFTAMAVAFGSSLALSLWSDINMPRLIIGGLISLVPGLVFVNALHEVAQKNLSSGSARMLEAFMIALNLSFGVAAALGFVRYSARFF